MNHAVNMVLYALEDTFMVPPQAIVGRSQQPHITIARHVGMVALMDQFGYSPRAAAQAFNRRSRDAVRNAQLKLSNDKHKAKISEFLARLADFRKMA